MKEELKLLKQAIGTLQRAVAILEDLLPVDTEMKQNGFRPPTRVQAEQHHRLVGHHFDLDQWFDHYEAKGWVVGKTKMKDWQASMRTWEREHKQKNPDRTVVEYDAHGRPISAQGDLL